ncbi:MAG TPA: class I SAM-dependent methyltransferase [Candidatus Sulfotelmatobacter sp.]
MSIKPLFKLMRNHQLLALTGSKALLKPFYQLNYLVAAKESGVLELLVNAPKSFEQLAEVYCRDEKAREALGAWLALGVRLGYLRLDGRGYALKGLAKRLALPQNDAAIALLQEASGLHSKLISQTLRKLRNGKLWKLEDQDGEIVARSSRIMEAFQTEAIDRFFPSSGIASLLEIGCGSGFYIKYAADRNPSLTAVGLELQPTVAEAARRNISEWGLAGRVRIEAGDIWLKAPDECFSMVTLYNNIYYFPVEGRVSLLEHVRRFIKPGGFLLLITCCQGGSLAVEVLNLWGAATLSGGRLPNKKELVSQLRQSGFQNVQTVRLAPGEELFAFQARNA